MVVECSMYEAATESTLLIEDIAASSTGLAHFILRLARFVYSVLSSFVANLFIAQPSRAFVLHLACLLPRCHHHQPLINSNTCCWAVEQPADRAEYGHHSIPFYHSNTGSRKTKGSNKTRNTHNDKDHNDNNNRASSITLPFTIDKPALHAESTTNPGCAALHTSPFPRPSTGSLTASQLCTLALPLDSIHGLLSPVPPDFLDTFMKISARLKWPQPVRAAWQCECGPTQMRESLHCCSLLLRRCS